MKIRGRYGRFLLLLVAIVVYLLLYPLMQDMHTLLRVALTILIPIAGVYAVSSSSRNLVIASILALPVVADYATPQSPWPPLITYGALAALYGFILVTVLREVVSSKRVTLDTLYGAAAAYLLIGLTWAAFYTYLERARPGSFTVPPTSDVDAAGRVWFDMVHFSYVSLTTVGYGDITPATYFARSLSFLEAATGVLFLAFLVARLVAAHLQAGTKE